MKGERVRAAREFDDDWVAGPLVRVIFGQFYSQTSGLDADGGVALRIKANGTPQNLGGDLVLLQGDAGVIEGVLSEVAEKFA